MKKNFLLTESISESWGFSEIFFVGIIVSSLSELEQLRDVREQMLTVHQVLILSTWQEHLLQQ